MTAFEIAIGLSCTLMFFLSCRDYAERKPGALTTMDFWTYMAFLVGAVWFAARLCGAP